MFKFWLREVVMLSLERKWDGDLWKHLNKHTIEENLEENLASDTSSLNKRFRSTGSDIVSHLKMTLKLKKNQRKSCHKLTTASQTYYSIKYTNSRNKHNSLNYNYNFRFIHNNNKWMLFCPYYQSLQKIERPII